MNDTPYLRNLTPLRGIAALLVIFFHADLFLKADTGILIAHNVSSLIKKGYLMVDFFFVLSGFIISYVYLSHFLGGFTRNAFKNFLVARFARVYPLHLLTLIWIVGVFVLMFVTGNYRPDPIAELHNNFWALPTQILLLHSMHLHNFTTWNGPSWSISVEWWAYMIFPFVIPFIARASKVIKALMALVAWAGMWWIVLYLNPEFPLPLPFPIPPQYTLDVTADFGFLRCLFGFVLGAITYFVYTDGWGKKIIGSSAFFFITVAAGALLMHFGVYDTFTVLAFPLAILSAAYNRAGVLTKILSSKPLQYLGDLSYSIYLTHVPVWATVLSIIQVHFPAAIPALTPLSAWITCCIWITVTIGVSAVTYKFIEVPARGWVKSVMLKRKVRLQPDSIGY
jgi:peptidoglycan/LPS O-acetylase OafA/YrhL